MELEFADHARERSFTGDWRDAWCAVLALLALLGAGCAACSESPPAPSPAAPAAPAPPVAPAPAPPVPRDPAPEPAAAAAAEAIWEGDSAGWHVRWTSADIFASRDAAEFSLAKRLRADFERELTALRADDARVAAERRARGDAPPPPSACVWTAHARLLSLVASVLSYRETRSTTCDAEAHPDAETIVAAVDLTKNGEPVTLDTLFPESAILSALRADKLVRRAIGNAQPRAASLDELRQGLAAASPVLDGELCYAFPEDLLSRFAFHHVQGERAAVRIGLPGDGPCRDNLTELGVLLPIPAGLRDALSRAGARAGGLLMSDAESAARGRETSVSLDSHGP